MSRLSVKAIPIQSIASTGLLAAFQALGTALPQSCFLIRLINGGTTNVTISYDGVTDHDVIIAGQTLQLPTPINTLPNSRGAQFAKGLIIYVRGAAGTTGTVTLAAYYTL
jgi:hypothetical protein